MSDVMEAPASGGAGGDDMGFVAKLHGIEGLVVVRPEAGEPVRHRLFEGLCGSEVDDMEGVLGKDGKGKTPLKWAGVLDRDDDIDVGDDTDMEDPIPPLICRPEEVARVTANAWAGLASWRGRWVGWRVC